VARKAISARSITFGQAISDNRNMLKTLVSIGKVLNSAALKTAPSEIQMLGAGPGSILRLRNLAPAKVHTLALFAHGSPGSCYIGKGLNRTNANNIIKNWAPYLASDVKILLFACSTARGPKEYKTSREKWVKGTLEKGGSGSLAFKLRELLIKSGKSEAQVWGHTAVGHVSRNPTLRVFYSSRGAGSIGESYVASYIFTPTILKSIRNHLKAEVISDGFTIPQEGKFNTAAEDIISKEVYNCWIKAAVNKLFQGRPLAEMAPLFPHQIAQMVMDYWNQTWWPARKEKVKRKLIKAQKLTRR
jgi:hypothetical protein